MIALGPALPDLAPHGSGCRGRQREPVARPPARRTSTSSTAPSPASRASRISRSRDADALAVATFLSVERLGYPPGRAQRARLLARLDALLATSEETAEAAGDAVPGQLPLVTPGVDLELHRAGRGASSLAIEWRASGLSARALRPPRARASSPEWEVVLLRTKPLTVRPDDPGALRGRVHVRTLRDRLGAGAGARARRRSSCPRSTGWKRLRLEAEAAGCAVVSPPGISGAAGARGAAGRALAEDDALRRRAAAEARGGPRDRASPTLGPQLDDVTAADARRRPHAAAGRPLEDRARILADLHMHTAGRTTAGSRSPTCSTTRERGLGAIAITDHNAFAGGLEAVELARGATSTVIPGEEIKTDGQGEVIGLFLAEEVPRGLSFAETVAAIRAQGGLVYVPHPFDRMHSIPDPGDAPPARRRDRRPRGLQRAPPLRHLQRRGAAVRAQVRPAGRGLRRPRLQGVGTGALRMPHIRGPGGVPARLRSAEMLRRPKSLVYLQGLKWVAQAKERVR